MAFKLERPGEIPESGDVAALLREYLDWVVPPFNAQTGGHIEVDAALARILSRTEDCLPPRGMTVLARGADGSALGVGFLRRIRTDAGEIKRLYARPEARGLGLGRAMVRALLDGARDAGMAEVYLDTAGFMHAAHALYRAEGFTEIDGYPEAEHPPDESPGVLYMVKRLG